MPIMLQHVPGSCPQGLTFEATSRSSKPIEKHMCFSLMVVTRNQVYSLILLDSSDFSLDPS